MFKAVCDKCKCETIPHESNSIPYNWETIRIEFGYATTPKVHILLCNECLKELKLENIAQQTHDTQRSELEKLFYSFIEVIREELSNEQNW